VKSLDSTVTIQKAFEYRNSEKYQQLFVL
jgi:hypothetical protein